MNSYDYIVIGGGPSGSNFARLIDSKYKVMILEKKDFNTPKSCGGLLNHDAQKAIAKLGLALSKEILVSPQVFSVKVEDDANNICEYYQQFYYNIDRAKFDMWLFDLIPNSVDKKTKSSFVDYIKKDDGYIVKYIENKEIKEVFTKYIVAADGANSIIRKKLNLRKPYTYISIQLLPCLFT